MRTVYALHSPPRLEVAEEAEHRLCLAFAPVMLGLPLSFAMSLQCIGLGAQRDCRAQVVLCATQGWGRFDNAVNPIGLVFVVVNALLMC